MRTPPKMPQDVSAGSRPAPNPAKRAYPSAKRGGLILAARSNCNSDPYPTPV